MTTRTILAIFLALICGASAAWGVFRMSRSRTVQVAEETTPVLVAAVDIQRGRTLTEEDFKLADWPVDLVQEGALTELEAATGRVALMEILAGDLLVEKKLTSEGSGRGLAALIPDKLRAYTIQTTAVASTVAGLILPGNRVDVLMNMKGSNDTASGGSVTRALMQSVEILAVGQVMQAPAEDKIPGDVRSVTLLVTPEQASILDVATKIGTLSLSLRNPIDLEAADTPPALAADIQFRQELPLGESLGGTEEDTMLGAFANALTTFLAKSTEAEAPAAADKQPKFSEIVTLRGSSRGRIIVQEFPRYLD